MQGLTSDSRHFFFHPPTSIVAVGRRATVLVGALFIALLLAVFSSACASHGDPAAAPREPAQLAPAAEWTIASPTGTPRPPFEFSSDDNQFLDDVQRAAFWYLWNACDPVSGMVRDRTSTPMVSIAGVGFQLAAIPAAAQRGWITEDAARERTLTILRALESCPTNRKAGLFYHFLDNRTAAPQDNDAVSTIDSAILFAGMLIAGERFGGEVRQRAARLFAAADWSFFVIEHPRAHEPYLKGFISLGWKPKRFADPTGDGALLPYAWADAGDEQRLVCFLAAAAPDPAHRVDPAVYYRLRRMLGEHNGSGVHVWFPWSGALFTHFFAQCFIDYAHLGPDDPAAHAVVHRPRVDWWENARRAVAFHRIAAIENPKHLPTLGQNAWGLTASDAATGYAVPGIYPTRIPTSDQIPQFDFADFTPKDDFGDGTIAPYGAGCSIMFEPAAAVAALRSYRSLNAPDGAPLVWRDPGPRGQTGEFGFRDSFNLGTNWTAPDCVAIDNGPLVLAVENARSGLIWKLFGQSPEARAGLDRLGLTRTHNRSPEPIRKTHPK